MLAQTIYQAERVFLQKCYNQSKTALEVGLFPSGII